MSIHIGGFFNCACGKMHTASNIDHSSRCTCGRRLIEELRIHVGRLLRVLEGR